MNTAVNRAAQHAAEAVQEQEAKKAAVLASRATYWQAWIAFAALMLTMLGIGSASLVAFTQLNDKVTATQSDTSDLKTEMRTVVGTVNLMAGRLGVQPQVGATSGLSRGKEPIWEESVFASSTEPVSPLAWCDGARSAQDSDFCDVPAHVGIIAGVKPEYFEAITSGVRSTPVLPSASVRPIWIDVPDATALVAYLRNQVGEPYDWGAIIDDAVGRTLPWDVLRRRNRTHICSTLVLDALLVGGVSIAPEALPETPNELLQSVQELAGISTHQGPSSPRRTSIMLAKFKNWIYNRALRLSHSTTVALAKATNQKPETIEHLNDAAAGFVEDLIPSA